MPAATSVPGFSALAVTASDAAPMENARTASPTIALNALQM